MKYKEIVRELIAVGISLNIREIDYNKAVALINKNLLEYSKLNNLSLSGVGSSEITTNDLDTEFIIIRDDLVEIEKGSVVVLLEINSSGRHEFMDKSNDVYWFEADCVKRKK